MAVGEPSAGASGVRVRRVCFGYGTRDDVEDPAGFVAGFRAERAPMMWVREPAEDQPELLRVPNVGRDTDPAWRMADPNKQWWALADVTGFPGSRTGELTRVGWTLPVNIDRAQLLRGDRFGDATAWEDLDPQIWGRLTQQLAAESHQYFSYLGEPGAAFTFLRQAQAHIAHQVSGGGRPPGLGPYAQVARQISTPSERGAPPRSEWLGGFDQRHDAARAYSVAQTHQQVMSRSFTDRASARRQRRLEQLHGAQFVPPTVAGSAMSLLTFNTVSNFAGPASELYTGIAVGVAATGFMAWVAHSVTGERIAALRGRLMRSLGMPDALSPTDHPGVIDRAGYKVRNVPSSSGAHTVISRARIAGERPRH